VRAGVRIPPGAPFSCPALLHHDPGGLTPSLADPRAATRLLRPVRRELSTTYPQLIHIEQGRGAQDTVSAAHGTTTAAHGSTPAARGSTNNYKEEVQQKKYKEVLEKGAENRNLVLRLPDQLQTARVGLLAERGFHISGVCLTST